MKDTLNKLIKVGNKYLVKDTKKRSLNYKSDDKQLLAIAHEESSKLKTNDRRAFLKKAGVFSATSSILASSVAMGSNNLPPNNPNWSKYMGKGVVSSPYGSPVEFEKSVVRRNVPWLTADAVSSISFTPLADLEGIITPSGVHFERYHSGYPTIPPEEHRLMIHGLVERPLLLDMNDIKRFPSTSMIRFLECPANGGMEWRGPQMEAAQFLRGMIGCSEWTGVELKVLLQEAGIKPEGKWILAEGADGAGMTRSIPLEKAMDDAIVAFAQNGEALRAEQGYPVRLFIPGWEGNVSVKWLRRLKVGDKPWHHREETSKYTDLMADGSSRRFTWEMESNSIITSPSPEKPWNQKDAKGWHEIEGFAWTGKGKIKYVDISFDGGKNWQQANLKGAVLPKALTRFSLMYKWDGRPLLLQSRAVDDTGYVQPTIKSLRAKRGNWSIYHNNYIVTWKMDESGIPVNVQLD